MFELWFSLALIATFIHMCIKIEQLKKKKFVNPKQPVGVLEVDKLL